MNKPKQIVRKQAAKKRNAKNSSRRSARIPEKIWIRHEPGYRTRHIGKYGKGNQFMAFVVAAGPRNRLFNIKWYATLHLFDREGNHIESQISYLGSSQYATNLGGGWTLEEIDEFKNDIVHELGNVRYCDIRIKLFSVKFDGHRFGLVDASIPKEHYVRVDLLPNDLAFFPPWNGDYET